MKLRPLELESGLEDVPVRRKVEERAALKELSAVYRQADGLLEAVVCERCGGCCALARTRREPYLFPVEFERLKRMLVEAGRAAPAERADGACRLLDATGLRCSVYAARPLGCRTFFCERGKGPGARPDVAIRGLSARLTRVSDRLDPGAKPRPISELLEEFFLGR